MTFDIVIFIHYSSTRIKHPTEYEVLITKNFAWDDGFLHG